MRLEADGMAIGINDAQGWFETDQDRDRLAPIWWCAILGFDHLLIKAHGRSNQRAVNNALKVADRCVRDNLVGQMKTGLAAQFESKREV